MPRSRPWSVLLAIGWLMLWVKPLLAGGTDRAATADKVDFVRDVQPIFQRHCYACHAGQQHEGGLRWDRRESAMKGGDSGEPAIVPGAPEKSQALQFARRTGDEHMPPDGKGEPVPADKLALLASWVQQGAAWPDSAAGPAAPPKHWAFIKPERPALPKVSQADWPRDPLDRFVLARLEREHLKPSPEADRYTLIRRVSLDLVGLPPTPEEADAFVNDSRPDAYERLVDRLLASPHYGERWARMWLDLARYADSQGYEKDSRRTIWRYRDWVIDAFNRDLPYDRFTIEQLAGDLLPHPTVDQLIATGFHRNTMTNTEGGTNPEEFRVASIIDRTSTTGQVWMGLTLGCAQCHTHKYDPITQRDFYRFFAILNQTEDVEYSDERPTIPVPTIEEEQQLAALDGQIAAERRKLAADTPALQAAQAAWEKQLKEPSAAAAPRLGPWQFVGPFFATNSRAAHNEIFWPEAKGDANALRQQAKLKWAARTDWADGQPHTFAGKNAAFYLWRTIDTAAPTRVDFSLGAFNGMKLWLNEVLVLDKKVGGALVGDHDQLALDLGPGTNRLMIKISNGSGLAGFYFQATNRGLPPDLAAGLPIPPERRTAEQRQRLTQWYRRIAPEFQAMRQRIAALRQQRQSLASKTGTTTPILRELPESQARKTHVLVRGSFYSPGAEVQPGVLSSFGPLPPGAPPNRLGLAMWLVDRNNPLTARVAVNHFWERLFGTGIVATCEDFGTQGTPPSHPQLLDYLAVEFMDQGWSMKKLLRRLVTSATYRQSSRVDAQMLERDRDNRLLARGPHFRLEAEMVRDQALAASGLLSPKMYGPSVMPPQPEGVWQVVYNDNKNQWTTSPGEDKYRRGLYTYWRRTSPYPSMMAFDATSHEVCTIRRTRTNTPLAALVTLNDPVYVEAAQALARMTVERGGATVDERARFAFRRCLVRPPRPAELQRIVALHDGELANFRHNQPAASRLATGKSSATGAGSADLAAWTVVANVLLNLDETLTKM